MKLLQAIMKYHAAAENDTKASLIWQSIPQATVMILFYCAAVEKKPPVFDCFDGIPLVTHIVQPGCRSVYDVVDGFASMNPDNPKW